MDWLEVLVSAVIIAGAIYSSDVILRAIEPKVNSWVDRDSPHLDRLEGRK